MAIRLAIGASRWRLVRQLLAESLLLSALGAIAGAVLARWLSTALVATLSGDRGRLFVDLPTDWRVLGFAALLAVTTALLFGLPPAWRATRVSPGASIAAEGRGLTAKRERFGLRRGLVVAQIAFSLVLLAGALLFVRSLRNLSAVPAGFSQEGLIVASVNLRRTQADEARLRLLQEEVLSNVRAAPGVASASSLSVIPMGGGYWNGAILVDGPSAESGESRAVNFNRVGAGYFRTMGTTMRAGRDFSDRDTPETPTVAIVTESFVRRFVPHGSAIGARFRSDGGAERFEVIGVVQDVKYSGLREAFTPIVFFAATQQTQPDRDLRLVIRPASLRTELVPLLTRRLLEIDPAIVVEFTRLDSRIRQTLVLDRLMALLSGGFGAVAGLLATIGLYGVMSYMVARRRREIGIRMALGAPRAAVLAMILRETAVLVGVGLLLGIGMALASAPVAASLIFGVAPRDPITVGLSAALLAAIALAAGYLPASRAARVDPASTLRMD